MMSELRRILLDTSLEADYSSPLLREQAEAIDLQALGKSVQTAFARLHVISHASELLQNGTLTHPMQAILHATECARGYSNGEVSDAEFFAILRAWGLMCQNSDRANTAKRVQAAFNASDEFRSAFMRGE